MNNVSEQYTPDELKVIHMADHYTIFYAVIGQHLIDCLGESGERIVREATRRYGADRGQTRRELQLRYNVKINMKNLFSIGSDLPADPRFKGETLFLTPQERNHRTLYCPMANLWKTEGYEHIGRIYCEEFHPACYGTYAYGFTRVGLARTLTQQGDEFCSFDIVLRPEHLPENLLSTCFEQYDSGYQMPAELPPRAEAKSGYGSLVLRLYYYFLETIIDYNPDGGLNILREALTIFAHRAAADLAAAAEKLRLPLTDMFIEEHFPLHLNPADDPLWLKYSQHNACRFLIEAFYEPFKADISSRKGNGQ